MSFRNLFVRLDEAIAPIKTYIDWTAVGVAVGVFADIIPVIAGVFSIFWLGTQLYDYWFVKRKEKKNGNLGLDRLDS